MRGEIFMSLGRGSKRAAPCDCAEDKSKRFKAQSSAIATASSTTPIVISDTQDSPVDESVDATNTWLTKYISEEHEKTAADVKKLQRGPQHLSCTLNIFKPQEQCLVHSFNMKTMTLFVYDIKTKRKHEQAVPKKLKYGFASLILQSKLYIVGGFGSYGERNYASTYVGEIMPVSLKLSKLVSKDELHCPRHYHALTAVNNDTLLCVGGISDEGYTGSCEVYCISKDDWTLTSSLTQAKAKVGLAVFNNYLVYAYGGVAARLSFVRTEVYDSNDPEGGWSYVTLAHTHVRNMMPIYASSGAAQVSNTEILLCGGEDTECRTAEGLPYTDDTYFVNRYSGRYQESDMTLEQPTAFYYGRCLVNVKDYICAHGFQQVAYWSILEHTWTLDEHLA